jgi:GxxExxY protein
MDKIIYKDLSYKITGLLFKAHQELGIYRNEKQYCDFFEKLLIKEGISHEREYKFCEHQYGQGDVRCICDFIIESKIIVEFKSKNFITKDDYFQVKRYLTTLNLKLGILVNFRQKRLAPKRILNKLCQTY